MTDAVTRSPAVEPGTAGWEVRPARTEDAPAVAEAVAALLAELGATPPERTAIEAEARAHIADPSLGIVLLATVADAAPSDTNEFVLADPSERRSHLARAMRGDGESLEGAGRDDARSGGRDGAKGDDPRGDGAVDDDLLGVLTASWARAIQVAGPQLTIEVLWTRRGWRDRGVGAALVEALVPMASAAGAGRVEVGLPRKGFPALRATERFYLANGFERLGPRMRRAVP